jgi:hypothetical protein
MKPPSAEDWNNHSLNCIDDHNGDGIVTLNEVVVTKFTIANCFFLLSALETNAAKGVFNATSKTTAELRTMVGGENAARLRQLFGTNEKGAKSVLDNIKNVKLPEGLTKETMQAYRELINRVPDSRGTQAIRAKILDQLLK